MNESKAFSFLNPQFVSHDIEVPQSHFEQVIIDLYCHLDKLKCPVLALTKEASLASFFNEDCLRQNICSFQKMLKLPEDHEYAVATNEIGVAFSQRLVEEWSLLYLETYFSQCSEGRIFFYRMFKDGLFQKDANIFYCQTERFLNSGRKFPNTLAHSKLGHLFQNLEMSQISSRQSLVTFIESHDTHLKANLVDDCYIFLNTNLQKLRKQDDWNGRWYIFDVKLFAEDILVEYERQTKLSLNKLSRSKQLKHADFIFVCVLRDLCSGKLQNWAAITDINFSKHIDLFTQFRNS